MDVEIDPYLLVNPVAHVLSRLSPILVNSRRHPALLAPHFKMLLGWDACLPPPDHAKTSTDRVTFQETPEHREHRLRKQYEEALEAHRLHQTNVAKKQFEQIAADLQRAKNQRLKHRAQFAAKASEKRLRDNTPLWERRLRFAVHRNLAEVCSQLGLYVQAVEAYGMALDDDRSDFLVWVHAARAATMCGRLHVARRAFETAMKLRPGHWLCREAYVEVLCAIGDADDDVKGETRAVQMENVGKILRDKWKFWELERGESRKKERMEPEIIQLEELTWACLVDALRLCLERRLSGVEMQGKSIPVGHPIMFNFSPMQVERREISNKDGENGVHILSDSLPHEAVKVGDDGDAVGVPVVLDKNEQGCDDALPNSKNAHNAHAPAIATDGQKNDGDKADSTHVPNEAGTADGNIPADCGEGGNSIKQSSMGKEQHLNNNFKILAVPTTEVVDPSDKTLTIDKTNVLSQPVVKTEPEIGKQPELRRSSRQKQQADLTSLTEDRRQTRTGSGVKGSTQEDKELIQSMLQMCLGADNDKRVNSVQAMDGDMDVDQNPEQEKQRPHVGKERVCSWKKVVDERSEAAAVEQHINSIENQNSGPTDLLLRVLADLSKLKVTQYSPTIALLWSTLRAKLQVHMPDSLSTTAMIVEALLLSGKKAGKAKASRFEEARRLLSHVKISTADGEEINFLKIRAIWLYSLLHESQGEMQRAYIAAEQALDLLNDMEEWREKIVPDCLGPDLSGYKYEDVIEEIQRRISGMKMARDLEKAQEELSKIGEGDRDAAKRTVSILSPSVHNSIRQLALDKWDDDDLKVEFSNSREQEFWEKKLDAETELEPQLAVYGEACAKSADAVGQLVCFSVRLRMAVHYYAAKLRSELESDGGPLQSDSDSSIARLADLLTQIRKYVLIIKKLSAPFSSEVSSYDVGISGWSIEQAANMASITLVSLVALIMTKIPLLKYSSMNSELNASQKNKRLAFTRCMLAFARCMLLVRKCRQRIRLGKTADGSLDDQSDPVLTREMLDVVSFCLKALVARGCCREEGTSGALIKLYAKFLCYRLQQLSLGKENITRLPKIQTPQSSTHRTIVDRAEGEGDAGSKKPKEIPSVTENTGKSHHSDDVSSSSSEAKADWNDVTTIRRDLAQCFLCLYQIQELESPSRAGGGFHDDSRWLEEGCRVSRHIGLSFSTGDPGGGVVTMDADVCKNVFLFYRRQIFEAICLRRRDGGRAKRLRDVLSCLAENLPEDPPSGLTMLSFQALDNIVTDVVEKTDDISRGAAENVSRLEQEWKRCREDSNSLKSSEERIRDAQLSTTFFEVSVLHVASTLAAYDVDYKKHKTAERRKRPKEVADRLLSASSECLLALRSRPWSVGAWILLGRIFVEIADLALDERELCLSSFGLYRAEEMTTLTDGDTVATVFGRAEACFGFAASLLRHPWAAEAASVDLNLHWSYVLGLSFDGSEESMKQGIGDDGDLFGSLGLTNSTTSRAVLPIESHPKQESGEKESRRLVAIRFGEAAVSVLRLRELRYFHSHWTENKSEPSLLMNPQDRFPKNIIDLAELALKQLKEGQELLRSRFSTGEPDFNAQNAIKDGSAMEQDFGVASSSEPQWRLGYMGIERLEWYFSLTEAMLMRKCGRRPDEYLPIFQRAIDENKRLKTELKQAPDIEPIYKLHSSRVKLLRIARDNDNSTMNLLTLLEQHSFSKSGPPTVRLEENNEVEKEDVVTERKIAIAEDILSAMQFCRDPKSDVLHAEYYFKATYCRAVVLYDVLKDINGALEELGKLFKIEAAARVLDQGPDGVHRGYFYKIWNYRITDTGIEPAMESERKLVRWRSKILGLYVELLKRSGEWRLLAAIIYRLKKRSSEDLPVDGALLDDLIMAYATTSRTAILNSMKKGILTNADVFESSFRRTWDIYVETLRLAQGIKRVRVNLFRIADDEVGGERLVRSGRPWCLVAIHTALRLEYMRWKSAQGECEVDVDALRDLPMDGKVKGTGVNRRLEYAETLKAAVNKWPLDEKLMRLLTKRLKEYSVRMSN